MINSPIKIPIGFSGDCIIKHENGMHILYSYDRGVWMTDSQFELELMNEAVEKVNAKGKGLVGGLGLGIVATLLGAKNEITSIDIVEKSQDVVNLVAEHLNYKEKYNIIISDIFDFLKNLESWPYDFVILDTWQGESAETWFVNVMPLKRLIANKFGKQNIHCWVEDKMKVELLELLTKKEPYWILNKLPMPMTKDEALWFVDNVGLPEWEKLYGEKI